MKPDISGIPVTLNGVEYFGRDIPPDAQEILCHCVDLRAQLEEIEFKHAQINTAKQAMEAALDANLKAWVTEQQEAG